MKLIVGLGNPGRNYINSRHNIGFAVIKRLAKSYRVPLKKERNILSLTGKCKIQGQEVILALPLTFMNLSGVAVSTLLKKYKIDSPRPCAQVRGLDNLLVVCDDLDLEFGRLKIRATGSSGGHRGLEDIIDSLRTKNFCRLRIGIGRPKKDIDLPRYVLSPFNKREKDQLKETIGEAVDCCRLWITKGIAESMNIFNRRSR